MSAAPGSTAIPPATRRPMTLWRLEVARAVRTHRWLIVVGVYALFGVLGPVTARYINEIIARFGGGVQITAPDPQPADGIVQFLSNASQLGLLAVAVVAAGALAVDARPEVSAFLRTKVDHPRWLVVPPYLVTTAVAALALVVGTVIAWSLSVVLLGAIDVGALVVGTLYGIGYHAFAVAVVAAVASAVRGQGATILTTIGVLLAFPIVGVVDAVRPWLPSELLTAAAAMVAGVPAGDYVRAVVVTVVATPLLVLLAVRRTGRREL
ncbi:hypothetical protein [Euzebya sp.]|uniref:hypothetical protein n=1 Tax=Euzebya sp. TaxID=1971409 RepID=UPI003512B65C